MKTRTIGSLAVVSALVLAGCGGGGGGGSSTPPPPPPPATYALSATVSGLNGTLVLQNNGGGNSTVTTNGTVAFGTGLAAGTAYNITVATQPVNPAQECVVTSGSGTLNSNVTVTITCANIPLALTGSTPANDATGVEPDAIPTLTFSRTLNASTATSATVTLSSSAGTEEVSPAATGNALNVGHPLRLRPMTRYTLTASTALQGTASEVPAAPIAVNFTTRDAAWQLLKLVTAGIGGFTRNPHIAMDAADRQLVIWEQDDGTKFGLRFSLGVNGVFGAPANLPGGSTTISQSTLAMNPAGNAIIVWTQDDGVRESVRGILRLSNNWAGLQSLEQNNLGDAEEPQAIIDTDSRGLVVFAMSDGTRKNIHARHFDTTGFGLLQLVETNNAGDAIDPQVAIGPGGTAHVIWSQSDGAQTSIWENTVPLGGNPGSPMAVENIAGNAFQPQIAVDAAGNVFAAWRQFTNGVMTVYANRRSANGTWGTPVPIEASAGSAWTPSLAVDRNGNALVVWPQATSSQTDIWAIRYDVVTGWSTAVLLENDDIGDAYLPAAAFDPSGNASVVWTRSSGTQLNFVAVRMTPTSGFSNPTDIQAGVTSATGMIHFTLGTRGTGFATFVSNYGGDNLTAVKAFE